MRGLTAMARDGTTFVDLAGDNRCPIGSIMHGNHLAVYASGSQPCADFEAPRRRATSKTIRSVGREIVRHVTVAPEDHEADVA
jgi:N-acetylglucosamine-6-phosphate deacetylase